MVSLLLQLAFSFQPGFRGDRLIAAFGERVLGCCESDLQSHLPCCRFWLFLVYLFLIHQMGTALFRLMGALGREISRTNVFGSFALVLVILLGGFALKYQDIHPW